MNIFNFLKKDLVYSAGIYIQENGQYQLIELQKINRSFFPAFFIDSEIKNFMRDGVFYKQNFVNELKRQKKYLKSNSIKINSLENTRLENEIISALKIVGFENVKVVKDKNIKGLIIRNTPEEQMVVYFNKGMVSFITTYDNLIVKEESLELSELNIKKIVELTKNLKEKHIFLVGVNQNLLKTTERLFYRAGIKVHLQNIWSNFLSFSDGIPLIFPNETYKYLDVLSITVPDLKKWGYSPLPEKEKNEDNSLIELGDKKVKREKKFFLKKRKLLYLPKPKIKNIFKKNNSPVVKTVAKDIKKFQKKEKKKSGEKVFLPKRKKLYLPKIKTEKNKGESAFKRFWKILNSKI